MKKKTWIALCCLCVGILCGGIGIYKYFQEKQAGSEYEKLKEEVTKKEPQRAERTEGNATEEVPSAGVNVPIDFATLQQQNPDVYAWITVGQTTVDYPILQHSTDNSYYLNHTIDGEEKLEGAIYTENYNTKTFEDPNTVIYGHDMKNGTMFQSLHKYMDRSFFDANRDITIYMPNQIFHYKIFAAYLYDDRHLMMHYNFWNPEDYQQYLDSIFSIRDMNAFIDTSVKVDHEDKIITLSTCYAGNSAQRYLVQAVLVSIEK